MAVGRVSAPATPTETTGASAPGQWMSFIITLGSWDAQGHGGGGSPWEEGVSPPVPAGGGPLLPSYTGGTWLSVPLYAPPGSHTAVPAQAVAVCAAQDPESESCGVDPSIWGAARNLWEVLGSTLHPDGWHGGARERDLTTRWMVHRAAASGTQPVAPCRSHQHPQKHTSSVTLRSLNSRRS